MIVKHKIIEHQVSKQLISLLEQLGENAQVSFTLSPSTRSLRMTVLQTVNIDGREETKSWEAHTSQRAIRLMPKPDHLIVDCLETAKKAFRNIT